MQNIILPYNGLLCIAYDAQPQSNVIASPGKFIWQSGNVKLLQNTRLSSMDTQQVLKAQHILPVVRTVTTSMQTPLSMLLSPPLIPIGYLQIQQIFISIHRCHFRYKNWVVYRYFSLAHSVQRLFLLQMIRMLILFNSWFSDPLFVQACRLVAGKKANFAWIFSLHYS